MGLVKYNKHNPCIMFVASRDFALANSRSNLIKHFCNNGWRVVTVAHADQTTNTLKNLGAITEPLEFKRGGISLLSDWQTLKKLNDLYDLYKPEIVHLFHAKPIILGNLAARKHRQIKVVNTVTGLGHAFVSKKFIYNAALIGYKFALQRSSITIFQNESNQEFFTKKKLVEKGKTRLIVSSGVDVQKYQPNETLYNPNPNSVKILFASRLLKSKGIKDFLDAAAVLSSRNRSITFQVAGEWDDTHPDAISREVIKKAVSQGNIEFLGYVDLAKQLKKTDIFVYPSYYAEGVARVLLEAAASGVPIVTTNVPGCREVVQDGKNGILVEPHNTTELINAIENLINFPDYRKAMGESGRYFVLTNFELAIITKAYLDVYRELGIII